MGAEHADAGLDAGCGFAVAAGECAAWNFGGTPRAPAASIAPHTGFDANHAGVCLLDTGAVVLWCGARPKRGGHHDLRHPAGHPPDGAWAAPGVADSGGGGARIWRNAPAVVVACAAAVGAASHYGGRKSDDHDGAQHCNHCSADWRGRAGARGTGGAAAPASGARIGGRAGSGDVGDYYGSH